MKRNTIKLTNAFALATALLVAELEPTCAATRTWSGAGGDGKWSTPANWGGAAPANGDLLVFNGAGWLANTNDLSNLSIAGLRFQNGGFQLYGNPVTLTTSSAGLVTNLAGLNAVYLGIVNLQANKAWYAASGTELVLAGTIGSPSTAGGTVMLDGGGTVRFTGTTLVGRGIDLTNGTIIVDGGNVTHTNDGFRFKARAGSTGIARLLNNGTWRWGGGANFRLGNSSAAGSSRMYLESGTLELYGSAVSIFVGDTAVAGSSSIFTQTGGAVLSTGSGNNDLYLGTSSGAECIYNLDGGSLMIRRIRANSTGQGIFNFNGGRLLAKTSDTAFLQDIGGAYIKAGGAIIDSSTNTITIVQPLLEDSISTGGGLTKLGSGTLNLTGSCTYRGATVVGGGTLGVPALAYPSASALIMSNSAALNLDASGGFSSLAAPGLTLDDNTKLIIIYGSIGGNPSSPAISDATTAGTTLNARGTNILINISGTGFVAGQFPIIKYSGSIGGNGYGAFKLGTLPPGVIAQLVNNTASGSIDVSISIVVNALTWNGNLSPDWDLNTTANWKDPFAASSTYKQYGTTNIAGDIVTFDDSLSNDGVNPPRTNINLTTPLQPAILNVSSITMPYSFGGPGSLSGSVQLNVSGSGSLKISTANSFTGGTTMSAGTQTLLLDNDTALGTGPISMGGGTISSADATPRLLPNTLAITSASAFGVDGTSGALTFSGPVSYGGAARTLTVNSDVTLSGAVSSGGVGRKLGLGTLTLSGVTGAETAGDWQIEAGQILVSGGSLSKTVGGIRIMCLVPGGFSRFTINGGTLTMTGNGQNMRIGSSSPNSDATAMNIANIAGTLTWTTNNVSGAVQMGANCAFAQLNLLPGGLLRIGYFAPQGVNNMEVNCDGGTLAPMSSRTDFMQGLTWANIRNGGLKVDTTGLKITIAQALLAGGTGGLTKNGLGTLTVTGTNTYTGDTLVNAGTLVIGAAHAAPGTITVVDGAELGFLSDAAGVTVGIPSAILGTTSGAGLLAQFTGRLGNPTAPAGYVTNLTLNGLVPVSLSLGGIQPGIIPLVRYSTLSGSGSIVAGNLPQGVSGVITNNLSTRTIELVVTSVTPLSWIGAGSSYWDIATSTNWILSGTAKTFQNGDNVRLDDSAVNTYVAVTQAVSPGGVVFSNSALAYNLSPSGSGKISGSTGITKDGTNILTLGGANDYTGDVIIKNGILELANAAALGSTNGATYVSNGATLNMKDIRLAATLEPIYIIGQGFKNLGALYSDTGLGNADFLRDLRLMGDAWVGAATGVRFGYSDVAGTITCVGGPYRWTKVGGGQFDFEEATVTLGEIEVKEGVQQMANATTINPGYGITVQSNAEFRIYQVAAPLNRPFVLNNGRINATGGAGTQNQLDGEITLNTAGTIQVGSGFLITTANSIKGAGNLIKTGNGLLNLTAVNTFTGGTVISNGTLALAFGASIATSPSVFVNTGATFDVSADSPWTLAPSQTLSGGGTINGTVTAIGMVSPGASIGTLLFNNDLTLAGTIIMEVTTDGGVTNDIVSVAGVLTYGGVLKVVSSGTTPLAVNDTFKLFSFLSAPAGSFSQILLPSDYIWDTTQLSVDGTVRVAGIAARPILGVTHVGNSLQFTWTGTYKLQSQTNSLDVGISTSWQDYPGGSTSGVAVPIDQSKGAVFFRLSTP